MALSHINLQRITLYEVGELALIVPRFAVLAICPPFLSHYTYIIPLFRGYNKDDSTSGHFVQKIGRAHRPLFWRRK